MRRAFGHPEVIHVRSLGLCKTLRGSGPNVKGIIASGCLCESAGHCIRLFFEHSFRSLSGVQRISTHSDELCHHQRVVCVCVYVCVSVWGWYIAFIKCKCLYINNSLFSQYQEERESSLTTKSVTETTQLSFNYLFFNQFHM